MIWLIIGVILLFGILGWVFCDTSPCNNVCKKCGYYMQGGRCECEDFR